MKTHRIAWQRTICLIVMVAASASQPAVKNAYSQVRNDSLPEIQIISTRYNVPAISQPQQVLIIGENALGGTTARDLVSLLSMYGHAYLRSNGPGLASGLTQRGFGTTSFQVVRDGFVLNQPMHGQVDMALIPVASLGFAEIATANTSSTFGSAASGGSLLLGNNWRNGWSLAHEMGPWGYRESHGSIVDQIKATTFSLNAGLTASNNDYRYDNPDLESSLRRENSSLDRKWLQLGTLVNNSSFVLRTNVYAHTAERGIPDPINFLGTQGNQSDEEVRATAEISSHSNVSRWSVGTQVWHSRLLYDDNWLTETSYNRVRGASIAFNHNYDLAPWFHLTSNAGGEVIGIKTNNYDSPASRNSIQGSVRGIIYAPLDLMFFPAIRVDIIEGVGTALSPSLGLNKAILPNMLHVRSQYSYNFTAPTLNDQFWNYGGNPDLKSERAHKMDLGLHLNSTIESTILDWQIQAYFTRAENGIIWQPGEAGMWSPVNLQEMHGHGIEQSMNVVTRVGDVTMNVGTQTTWNRAYIPTARYNNDKAVKKQLRYTPERMLRVQAGTQYRTFSFNTEIAHNGKRFTSEDHSSPSDPMPAFTVTNFSTEIRIPSVGLDPSIRLSMVNAFDAKYSTIAWYPMPGRHLLIALRVGVK